MRLIKHEYLPFQFVDGDGVSSGKPHALGRD